MSENVTELKYCECGCGGIIKPGRPDRPRRFIFPHTRRAEWSAMEAARRLTAGRIITDSGCWEWTGAVNRTGYVGMNDEQRKLYGCAPDVDARQKLAAFVSKHTDELHAQLHIATTQFNAATERANEAEGRVKELETQLNGQESLRIAYCETLSATMADKYEQLRAAFEQQLQQKDERIRQLEKVLREVALHLNTTSPAYALALKTLPAKTPWEQPPDGKAEGG